MSDANAYMNAYVDNAVGMLHEYVVGILQLKTQLKICESVIATKDAEIAKVSASKESEVEQVIASKENEITDLRNQLIGHSNVGTENAQLQQRCNELQNENNALTQKVSHMDILLKQISEMKNQILERDVKIGELEEKLRPVEPPVEPVVINKKKVEKSLPIKKVNDDF